MTREHPIANSDRQLAALVLAPLGALFGYAAMWLVGLGGFPRFNVWQLLNLLVYSGLGYVFVFWWLPKRGFHLATLAIPAVALALVRAALVAGSSALEPGRPASLVAQELGLETLRGVFVLGLALAAPYLYLSKR